MNGDSRPYVVVGTGPAGVTAALALRARGLPVHMLEAGEGAIRLPPAGNYLDLRPNDAEQWRWMIGSTGENLDAAARVSPKLRVPGLMATFSGYASANHLDAANGLHLVGANLPGGLSNAWGCGVARFDDGELGPLAADGVAMAQSYARVSHQVGISGASDDALSAYFGLDDVSGPALALDGLHTSLWKQRGRLPNGMAMGRARVAVLGKPRGDRAACDLSGLCLWGCPGKSTWSAAFDLETLRRDPGVTIEFGAPVDTLAADGEGGWLIGIAGKDGRRTLRARRVLLAAGTIASTRLALAALPSHPESVRLQSNPMAAFLLALPRAFGAARERGFGLAQLSFVVQQSTGSPAFGNLFSTTGIPVGEFLQHLPMTRHAGIPLLRALLPATVVGNVFLPGASSDNRLRLGRSGDMSVEAVSRSRADDELQAMRRVLTKGFRRTGAWMLPGSFTPGAPGADLHYACTLPIASEPKAHECRLSGEVAGLPGVYAVDGASLPVLPAKAHTLTIMANADRIARQLDA